MPNPLAQHCKATERQYTIELRYELQKYTSQLLTFFLAVPTAFPADSSSPS
jgi:hypothetical protein